MNLVDRLPIPLRWILVLPLAMLSTIPPLLIVLFGYLTSFGRDDMKYGSVGVYGVVSSLAFIWVGTRVAPKFPLVVSSILSTLWLLYLGSYLYLEYAAGDNTVESWGRTLYYVVFGLIGVIISLWKVVTSGESFWSE